MNFDETADQLEAIYVHENTLAIVKQLLPSLSKPTVQAIQVLRYCRLQLLESGMMDRQISTLSIASDLADAGIPEHTCLTIENAILPYLEDLDYINSSFLENLELKLIGIELLSKPTQDL